jgi:hypothetical protein
MMTYTNRRIKKDSVSQTNARDQDVTSSIQQKQLQLCSSQDYLRYLF